MNISSTKGEQTQPSSKNEQTKDQKQNQSSQGKKAGAPSSHTTSKAKRPHAEVAESSAEEMQHLHNQIDEIGTDLKTIKEDIQKINEGVMKKEDMVALIKSTVEEIMKEINKNIEVTIEIKLEEKTRNLNKEIETLKNENAALKNQLEQNNSKFEKKILEVEKLSMHANEKANRNEQYSMKHNLKIMGVAESNKTETKQELINKVFDLFKAQNVTINKDGIQEIHRLPSKKPGPKPVIIKTFTTDDKATMMRARKQMNQGGHRLVDHVTKPNTELIQMLNKHREISSAWYFNGSVYGETVSGRRIKFDLHDDVDAKIATV